MSAAPPAVDEAGAPGVRHAVPAGDLGAVVKCFWEVRLGAAAPPATALIVPDGSPEIVFELGRFGRRDAAGRLPMDDAEAIVAGQLTRSLEIETPGGYHAFGVRLQPWGALALLGDELPALTDRTVAVDTLLGARGRALVRSVERAAGFAARTAAAETWLRAHAVPRRLPAWLPWAGRRLAAGVTTVSRLADDLALSPRQFERVFLRGVGLPPKAFARQQRFARAAHAVASAGSLADLAAACGYADQAHMARDFRDFAGLAPSRLAQRLDAVSAALAGIDRIDVAFVQGAAPARG